MKLYTLSSQTSPSLIPKLPKKCSSSSSLSLFLMSHTYISPSFCQFTAFHPLFSVSSLVLFSLLNTFLVCSVLVTPPSVLCLFPHLPYYSHSLFNFFFAFPSRLFPNLLASLLFLRRSVTIMLLKRTQCVSLNQTDELAMK